MGSRNFGGSRKPHPGKQRRALTPARTPGRIGSGGEPHAAAALVEALVAPQDEAEIGDSVTHPLHTYPARMHPATARALVELVMGRAIEGSRPGTRPVLLDPFCGSGTTLVEGRYAGARARGVDANPLAVSIARAKTWTVPAARRKAMLRRAGEIAGAAVAEGKAARRAGYEPPELRKPPGVDPRARDHAIKDWFPPHVRRELEFIAASIDDVRAEDAELAEVLTVLLSSLLYKVSYRASDTDARRVSRTIARGAAARLFRQRAELLYAGLDELAKAAEAPRADVVVGDARDLGARIGPGTVDGVVTSPPYAGTYDYAEQHRLRLDFLGMPGSRFTAAEIGARRDLADRGGRGARGYERDLGAALAELARVLRAGGAAALMLGDSLAGPGAIFADDLLRRVLPPSLSPVAFAWQERPKLGRREHEAFGDRPKREHLFLVRRA